MIVDEDQVHRAYRDHAALGLAEHFEALGHDIAVSAHGATIRTAANQSLIDLASGGFGHGHPVVCARVAEQMRLLPLSSRMLLSRPLALLVEQLAAMTPGALDVSYPCSSEAEAMEGALKLALGYHRHRRRIVAFTSSYHGGTLGALSVCGIAPLRYCLRRLPLDATIVPYGDLSEVERAVRDDTAAVVLAPIATGVGVRLPPPGFVAGVRRRCTATGALLIVDETTTGLGRTGHRFAVERERVAPDILVLGDVLGGGVLPVAAYVAERRINDRVYGRSDPALHGTTTGGNPAACVAAIAALQVIEEEGWAARALRAGRSTLDALASLQQRYPGDILESDGSGLLAGVRFADEVTARSVQQRAAVRGALLRLDGVAVGEAWIGVRPPLMITDAELALGLGALEAAVDDVLASRPEGLRRHG